ncbi:MAG TPA: trypsin-like peptidase domain-containing protein [Acidobacteriaceae bacterium]|nr:trypsin-like peptidase domain-containing protein [Acidobacteriaceae bacterium]
MGKKRLSLSAGALLTTALGVSILFHESPSRAADPVTPINDNRIAALTALDEAVEAVAAHVQPAVVNIQVTSRGSDEDQAQVQGEIPPGLQQFFGPNGPFGGFGFGGDDDGQGQGNGRRGMRRFQSQRPLERGVGSGVIISPDGYIVTNNHVVEGAVNVKVMMQDRRVMDAKVVGTDKLTDLAVVKINAQNLPYLQWGDSTGLRPGQTVLAFGSPFGYFQDSVTRGIVSAVNRQNPYSDDARKPGGYIQTDAAINPGNSGGALVDAHGQLVGINTFIISNSGSFAGAGFAIPSQIAKSTADQIIAHGKVQHGYVGISMNDVTPSNASFFNLKDASGAIVAQVTPDSPASRAGLKTGDVIRELNGKKIADGSALQVAIAEKQPGDTVQLGIIRNGTPMQIGIKLGEYHKSGTQLASNDQGSGQGNTGKLGLAVDDLDQDTRQQLQIPADVKGAAVAQVRPGSPAEDAGLQPGDVIVEVNRKPVASAEQFANMVKSTPAGKDILLLVWSKGNDSYRVVHPSSGTQNGM